MNESPDKEKNSRRDYALLAGTASIVTVSILILIKIFAYWESGSVSILGSLVDSFMDAVVSLINFMAIRYALKPADHEHRYGHGKAEGLAALFQAAFISGAGVFLLFESVRRFMATEAPDSENISVIGIMVVSMILSLALIAIQNASLKNAPSLAVEAEKAHYSGDIAINGGVIVVLVALYFGAPRWIDPAFAVVIALYLWHTAKTIAVKGVDMLLDRELPDETREEILEIIKSHPETRGVHDLRTRKSGMDIHLAFDLELDPDKSLQDAHNIALAIEMNILDLLPNAEIMIHTDPYGIPHDESRHNVAEVHRA